MRRFAIGLFTALIAFSAAACTAQSAPAPGATALDPQALLKQAGQTIRTTKAVKLKLQVSGAPAFVQTTSAGLVQFLSLDGQYEAPDRVSASVKAKVLGISGQVGVIAIGDDQWYENAVLTGGKYLNDTFSPGFNAGKLVSSDQGITSALNSVTDLKLVGTESQFGAQVYHLSGVAPGAEITALTVGLIVSKASVNVDIYIDTTSLRAVDVVLTQPETITTSEPKPTTWDLELYDYDVPVSVTPPANAIVLTKAATSPSAATPAITAPSSASTTNPATAAVTVATAAATP